MIKIGLLFVHLGLWLSLKLAQGQTSATRMYRPNISDCYNTSFGKTCFTTFLASNTHPVRKPYKTASHWCKEYVPGFSLIIIKSIDCRRTTENFIRKHVLANETIIMDARMLSASESSKWSWANGQPYLQDVLKGKCCKFRYN